MWKMLEHKISWKGLNTFALECSNDDILVDLEFFYGQVCFLGFYMGKVMAFVEDLVQKLINTVK